VTVIDFIAKIPKSRSGKIMRSLAGRGREVEQITQDTTTLEDSSVVAKWRAEEE
jgi:acyl-coenzyme A synthetase/AMP-(fatty) acid ligase